MDEISERRRPFQFENILILLLVILVVGAVTLIILEWPKLLPLSMSLRSRLEADYGSRSLMETIGVMRLQIIEDVFRDLGLPVELSVIPTEELVPTATAFVPMDTATPTPSPSLEPTVTNTRTATATRTPTRTLTPTITPTPTWTRIPPTPTKIRTPRPPTATFTPSITPTPSNTPTPSDTPTPTITPTPSNTPTPTNTPLPDVSAPSMSVFVTYSRVGENQCEVKVTSADISDPYVSYGIGSTGSPYGDGNGYVRLIANTSTKDLTGSPSYTSPYGPFSGTYYGALILDAIGPDTPINTTVEVRDNAGNKTSKSDTNVGCQGSSGG